MVYFFYIILYLNNSRWISPDYDLILLQTISKIGIGTKEWETFLEDNECPFYKSREGKVEYKYFKNYFINF